MSYNPYSFNITWDDIINNSSISNLTNVIKSNVDNININKTEKNNKLSEENLKHTITRDTQIELCTKLYVEIQSINKELNKQDASNEFNNLIKNLINLITTYMSMYIDIDLKTDSDTQKYTNMIFNAYRYLFNAIQDVNRINLHNENNENNENNNNDNKENINTIIGNIETDYEAIYTFNKTLESQKDHIQIAFNLIKTYTEQYKQKKNKKKKTTPKEEQEQQAQQAQQAQQHEIQNTYYIINIELYGDMNKANPKKGVLKKIDKILDSMNTIYSNIGAIIIKMSNILDKISPINNATEIDKEEEEAIKQQNKEAKEYNKAK